VPNENRVATSDSEVVELSVKWSVDHIVNVDGMVKLCIYSWLV